jgi:hypothetical protein
MFVVRHRDGHGDDPVRVPVRMPQFGDDDPIPVDAAETRTHRTGSRAPVHLHPGTRPGQTGRAPGRTRPDS